MSKREEENASSGTGTGPAPALGVRFFGVDFAAAAETTPREESARKFECHFCWRKFPTSQALGGHQNAHKRERQQARRSAAMAAQHHFYGQYYHPASSFAPPFRSHVPSSAAPLSHRHPFPPQQYPCSVSPPVRFHGSSLYCLSLPPEPISSSMLAGGMWRFPVQGGAEAASFPGDRRPSLVPLFRATEHSGEAASEAGCSGGGFDSSSSSSSTSSSSSSSSSSCYYLASPKVQTRLIGSANNSSLSLDLHL